jgi:hypothetical protein
VLVLLLLLLLLLPSMRGTAGGGRNPPLLPPAARYQAGPSLGNVEAEEEGFVGAVDDDCVLLLIITIV